MSEEMQWEQNALSGETMSEEIIRQDEITKAPKKTGGGLRR